MLAYQLGGQDLAVMRIANALITAAGMPLSVLHPSLKKAVSQLAIESILVRGPQTISQIAEYVRERAGSASRTTIRLRMGELEGAALVVRGQRSEFYLTAKFVDEWWTRFEAIRRLGRLARDLFEFDEGRR